MGKMPQHFLKAFSYPRKETPISMQDQQAKFLVVKKAQRPLIRMKGYPGHIPKTHL